MSSGKLEDNNTSIILDWDETFTASVGRNKNGDFAFNEHIKVLIESLKKFKEESNNEGNKCDMYVVSNGNTINSDLQFMLYLKQEQENVKTIEEKKNALKKALIKLHTEETGGKTTTKETEDRWTEFCKLNGLEDGNANAAAENLNKFIENCNEVINFLADNKVAIHYKVHKPFVNKEQANENVEYVKYFDSHMNKFADIIFYEGWNDEQKKEMLEVIQAVLKKKYPELQSEEINSKEKFKSALKKAYPNEQDKVIAFLEDIDKGINEGKISLSNDSPLITYQRLSCLTDQKNVVYIEEAGKDKFKLSLYEQKVNIVNCLRHNIMVIGDSKLDYGLAVNIQKYYDDNYGCTENMHFIYMPNKDSVGSITPNDRDNVKLFVIEPGIGAQEAKAKIEEALKEFVPTQHQANSPDYHIYNANTGHSNTLVVS